MSVAYTPGTRLPPRLLPARGDRHRFVGDVAGVLIPGTVVIQPHPAHGHRPRAYWQDSMTRDSERTGARSGWRSPTQARSTTRPRTWRRCARRWPRRASARDGSTPAGTAPTFERADRRADRYRGGAPGGISPAAPLSLSSPALSATGASAKSATRPRRGIAAGIGSSSGGRADRRREVQSRV